MRQNTIVELAGVLLIDYVICRFPVAIYPNLIQQRLKSDYYRNVEAVKHDFAVMLSNARSYFESSGDLAKMKQLSDWVEKKIDRIS